MRCVPALLALVVTACAGAAPEPRAYDLDLPAARWASPTARASSAFWERWADGSAEIAVYRGSVSRYGAPRDAEATLIWVTEPFDRRTLIKDDAAPTEHRLNVLKLNFALRFQTGIYPYTVFTSVFSPVDRFDGERFAPAKLTFGEQDWCGQSFAALWPDEEAFVESSHSYFPSEGDRRGRTPIPVGALYEDALYTQLRELDGTFADGADWSGWLVPSLWHARRDHHGLEPVAATIDRVGGPDRTTFVLRADGGYERTFEVGTTSDHPLLSFRSSDGDAFELAGRERLPYWELHDPGEESYRERLGLSRGLEVAPAVAPSPSAASMPATARWATVLSAHVTAAGVRYGALVADAEARASLDDYVASLATMDHEAPLGAWIDAYNALVVSAIVRHWPTTSVREIPGFFDTEAYVVAGRPRTLDAIENEVIRARFQDARVHAALVCGARSCPILSSTPYEGSDVEARLEAAARAFAGSPAGGRIEPDGVVLSAIFQWFEADFARDAGSLEAWLARYGIPNASPDRRTFAPYDWRVNEL